ncbi:hypothetical protein [Xanthobacter aminoxidans]|uniref:hypothetical protein n=1 Tax=Xanthobacter aminoxidans TaxID=186280 RepID=UPI00372C6D12
MVSINATPVVAALAAAGDVSGWFPTSQGAPFNAWVLSGSWQGALYLEFAPAGATTGVPIVVGATRLYSFTQPGKMPVEEYEAGVRVRFKAGDTFSGSANVRISA